MTILLIGIGLFAGIVSGMGIGGGAILIPSLTILASLSQQQSQSINLIYFIPTAIVALITHFKDKNVETSVLLKIVIFGVIGAVIGAMIAVKLDSVVLKKLFGIFMLIIGVWEIFKKN